MFPSHKMLTVIVFACVAVYPGNGELFTSSAHLQNALWAEGAMASTIREYVRDQIQRLNGLSKLADNLEEHSSSLETPEGHIANPVNAYLFVKRFTIDWDRDFAALIEGKTIENLEERLTSYKDYLPNYEDLNGAVAALLRLQDTYNLDTDSIAHGNIYGLRSSELSAADCFELGRIAYQTEDFYHTHLWMEEALKLIEMEVNKTLGRPEILDYLAFSLFKEGDIKRALTLTEELLFLMPDHQRAQSNKVYYKKMLADQDEGKARGDDGVVKKEEEKKDIPEGLKLVDSYKVSDEFKTYEKLCRGETTHEYEDQHKLKCRYYNNNFDPLLILLPAKQEEVYLDPYLVFYHDVVTDYEMNVIKQLATPKLGRATVHNSVTGKLETANYRISKSAWLKSEDHPVISRVNNRIQAITSLDMNTAEELQVANYGLGGHYEPHFDFARKEETNAFKSLGTGNRIATWLTYMTDVEAGGATVFPYIGVKIFPEKGGAAFWYNLYKSGEGIYNTRHAACPVLVGTKWVSNKWIHERGQEFRRPCGLHPDE